MGNLLTLPTRQGNVPYEPNIPFNQNVNDINRPHSTQMTDLILHYAIPWLFIAAFAYREMESEKQRIAIVNESEIIKEELRRQLATTKSEAVRQLSEDSNLYRMINSVAEEEEKNYKLKMKQIEDYNEGLKTILDIKCSRFKSRKPREILQDELITKLSDPDTKVNRVITYSQLRDIYTIDGKHFCGRNREENGRLRQLYVEQWKHQLELEKYRNIVFRLENMNRKTN